MLRHFVAWLVDLPFTLLRLMRDIAPESDNRPLADAVADDVLDAAHDEDGMDATGL